MVHEQHIASIADATMTTQQSRAAATSTTLTATFEQCRTEGSIVVSMDDGNGTSHC